MIDKVFHPKDVYETTMADVKTRFGRGKELSIRSLPVLDDFLWGLKKQKLVVVAGRPSMGKSTLMSQIAYDLALQGKHVYFFSLEMTAQVCMERMISNRCDIDNYYIFTGKYNEIEDIVADRVRVFEEELREMPLKIVESVGKTFNELFQIIEGFQDPADCVVLDYVQLVKEGAKTQKQAMDEYLKQLREYALKKKFCCIVGSQINRSTHTKEEEASLPQLWEMKGSGVLEELADMVMLVHYDYFYTKKEESKNDYLINVAKNRDGRTGWHRCIFYPEFYKIEDRRSDGGDKATADLFAGGDEVGEGALGLSGRGVQETLQPGEGKTFRKRGNQYLVRSLPDESE